MNEFNYFVSMGSPMLPCHFMSPDGTVVCYILLRKFIMGRNVIENFSKKFAWVIGSLLLACLLVPFSTSFFETIFMHHALGL